jgi:hypothetical protein
MGFGPRGSLLVPTSTFSFSGLETFAAVTAVGSIYFQSNIPVIEYVKTFLKDQCFERIAATYIYLEMIRGILFLRNADETEIQARLDQMFRDVAARGVDVYLQGNPSGR